jgi:hypothetical protein
MMAKQFWHLAGAEGAVGVLHATVPVILKSRAVKKVSRLGSVALAPLLASAVCRGKA